MKVNIGNIEIPIISFVEERNSANISEIKDAYKNIGNVIVKHEPEVTNLVLFAFINEALHSSNISMGEQRRNIKSLETKQVSENTFNFKEYDGWLLVENVNIPENQENKIINEVEINARFFPKAKYELSNR